MKKQRDFETIFREGEKRIQIQPSPQAWNKLERRLSAGPKNGNIVFMRSWLSAAAALLVLVASVYIWSASNNSATPFNYMPEIVEDLNGSTDCNPYCLLIEGRKELPAYYASPLREELN